MGGFWVFFFPGPNRAFHQDRPLGWEKVRVAKICKTVPNCYSGVEGGRSGMSFYLIWAEIYYLDRVPCLSDVEMSFRGMFHVTY